MYVWVGGGGPTLEKGKFMIGNIWKIKHTSYHPFDVTFPHHLASNQGSRDLLPNFEESL